MVTELFGWEGVDIRLVRVEWSIPAPAAGWSLWHVGGRGAPDVSGTPLHVKFSLGTLVDTFEVQDLARSCHFLACRGGP